MVSQKEQEVQVLHIRFSILDARKRQKRKVKTSIEYLGSKYDSPVTETTIKYYTYNLKFYKR